MAICDRVPIRVHHTRQQPRVDQEPYELSAERFAGALLHPVPLIEMQDRFGIRHAGWKIVAIWPEAARIGPIEAGDRLEVGDQVYPVLGVVEYPTCYMDVYLAA
ncbi:MAG TPA: hypothetical protein VKX16_07040 [Chloroflexota bacterium]|nr:hypothetical protein [Chloroflexota bacterium]